MGTALTTFGQDPIPATTDAVLIPADVSQYAESIAHKIIHFVTDVAERDANYAAAAAPVFVMSPGALWAKISGSGGGSVWVTLWADSGSTLAGITVASNFDTLTGAMRMINEKIVLLNIDVTRRNSVVPCLTYNHSTSPGNIENDPLVVTLPVGWRPANSTIGHWRSGTTEGTIKVQTDGTVKLQSGNPNTEIGVDSLVELSVTFVVA